MKRLKFILAITFITIGITGCHKETNPADEQPTAAFTIDKDTFTAGDVFHLKDASSNAYSWKWTMPDGKTYTTQNVDFEIDSDYVGVTDTFKLEVASKSGSKTSYALKTVTVKELILPNDYFGINSSKIKPQTKRCGSNFLGYGNWMMYAEIGGQTYADFIKIMFSDTSAPKAGTYTLCPNYNSLITGQAYITITVGPFDAELTLWSLSGQLNVTITDNGKIHAIFSNIPSGGTYTISGNLTSH